MIDEDCKEEGVERDGYFLSEKGVIKDILKEQQ